MVTRREVITTGLLIGGSSLAPVLGAAEKASPRALAERYAATLSAGDMDAFAALFADDYINHQKSAASPPPKPGVTPKQASMAFFQARLTGMPDLKVAVQVVVADKDHVAASFQYSGKQTGVYMGVAPTGRRLTFTSCDIFRVQDGLLAEHWGMGDTAGILAQLHGKQG